MIIEKLRKAKNLTQNEVANMLHIARTTYQSYEKGRNEPSIEQLKALSKLFHVSIDTIVENQQEVSIQKKELLEIINQLTDIECRKLFNYAEGIIMNRQYEQKQKTLELFKGEI